jgi:hypothetical protein
VTQVTADGENGLAPGYDAVIVVDVPPPQSDGYGHRCHQVNSDARIHHPCSPPGFSGTGAATMP